MRMKHALVGLTLVLFGVSCVAAAYAGSNAKSGSTKIDASKSPVDFTFISIKIPGVDVYTDEYAGAQAAVKELNAKGGFGGRQVVLDPCNDMLQASVATVCAHKTIAKHPAAMFGCSLTWATTGLKIYGAAGVPSVYCPNLPQDMTDKWSFPNVPGAFGEERASARWLCTQKSVKSVVFFLQDLPAEHQFGPAAVGDVFKGCHKTVSYVYYPISAVDMTPYVTQVVQKKPDFVITLVGAAQVVTTFQAFKQAGFPIDHIIGPDSAFNWTEQLKPAQDAGNVMDGAYAASQEVSWDNTSDPNVKQYLAAMKALDPKKDPRCALCVVGYMTIKFFYNVAKATGFDSFNAQALANYMSTKNGVAMPLTHALTNPGPKTAPQVKQPYAQIWQWKGGKMLVVKQGTKGGWVYGY